MTRDAAERLTRIHGHHVTFRDKVALVTFVADHDWNAAAALADLWDLDEQRQEAIYKQTQEKK